MIDIEFSTIAFTIINLIVLFLLLKKFLIGPLNDVIKKREDMIAGTISDANNQKAEAMKLKSQYEDTLAGVDAECRDLREKSRVEAQNEYSRIIDQADAKSVKMIKDAEKTIEIKQNKALSDMQPQIAVTLALAEGTSIVTESIFENRFKYADELSRMGANIKVEGNSAIIDGVKKLTGARVSAPDLRAGAALVIAGLAADGITVVDDIVYIQRGYENFEDKLRSLGAEIERVSNEKEIQKFRLRVG